MKLILKITKVLRLAYTMETRYRVWWNKQGRGKKDQYIDLIYDWLYRFLHRISNILAILRRPVNMKRIILDVYVSYYSSVYAIIGVLSSIILLLLIAIVSMCIRQNNTRQRECKYVSWKAEYVQCKIIIDVILDDFLSAQQIW